ncbi:DsbA family protein [Rhizobiaceae bacterium CRRU44]|uniref:DsbA family protein n=1 Tax=Ferranicluibacter rubi TaxID=2715133 RepID=A0AA44CF06_9HYPH|nr:DsbA family protein [Ferranicluibacter rubi]NHT78677.1 DsbA family protein [Ferranicluibacter rubi]
MSLSEMTLLKRLSSGVAIATLALALVACSDEKKEAANAAAPVETVDTATKTEMKPADTMTTSSTTATPATTPAAGQTQMAQAAAPAASPAAAELPQAEGEIELSKLMEPGALPEMAIGKADAPVTVVEYMSMTCPHCANFHNKTFDAIKAKYVESGKVRFVLREFPFDPRAAAAFMLARCAPEGQYFPMVSMLFKQQEQWAAAQNGRDALLQMSKLAGFSQESFETCLTNQKLLDDVNAVMQKGMKEYKVASTPTFFINGKRYSGDMSVDTMSALIDPLL